MAVGAVTFHNDRKVKRFHVKEKDNAIVNRLNKTKREVEVDHEAERQDRLREEGRKKKAKAIEDVGMPTDVLREYASNWRLLAQKKNQLAEQKRRKEESEARDYSKRKPSHSAFPDHGVLMLQAFRPTQCIRTKRWRQNADSVKNASKQKRRASLQTIVIKTERY